MKIGFIGLGIMGSRMAGHLLAAGHQLTVHNRTRGKAEELLAKGASWADTPADAARDVEVLITVLAEPATVEALAHGAAGFLGALPANGLWMDCSTVSPAFSRQMAAEATGRGLRFLDAPVAGTKGPAAKAELTFLVGGAEADLEQVRPLMEVMGKTINHMGEHGMGSSMKMVLNMLLGMGLLAFVEALTLGEAQGIPRQRLLDTLVGGRMVPPFMAGKKDKFANENWEADFPLQWLHKDLHLAVETAYAHSVALPATHNAKEVYGLARKMGLGEEDICAVWKLLNPAS